MGQSPTLVRPQEAGTPGTVACDIMSPPTANVCEWDPFGTFHFRTAKSSFFAQFSGPQFPVQPRPLQPGLPLPMATHPSTKSSGGAAAAKHGASSGGAAGSAAAALLPPLRDGSQLMFAPTGFVFLCNDNTIQECLDHKVFGLPHPRWRDVRNIVSAPKSARWGRGVAARPQPFSCWVTWTFLPHPSDSPPHAEGVYVEAGDT